ncbi:hypothetical protein E2C01_012017 [Portunus trituberculatus]|uniref:Uncharacterized protein n=1 Tax=Portunus trituberculatus TaxID=210409 RepID=A0A5B7DD04_PORTR|nr:hypothetical protein [Portunus trituberculatus]
MAPPPHHTTLSPPRHTQPTASPLFPYTLLSSSGLYLMFINVDRHFYIVESSVNSAKPLKLARLIMRRSYSCFASVLSASSVTFAPITLAKKNTAPSRHSSIILLPLCTSPRGIPLTTLDRIKIIRLLTIVNHWSVEIYAEDYSILLAATVAATSAVVALVVVVVVVVVVVEIIEVVKRRANKMMKRKVKVELKAQEKWMQKKKAVAAQCVGVGVGVVGVGEAEWRLEQGHKPGLVTADLFPGEAVYRK